MLGFYGGYVDLLVRQCDLRHAIEVTELARARTYLEQMSHGNLPPPPVLELHRPLLEKESELLQKSHRLEELLYGASTQNRRQHLLQLEEMKTALDQVWSELAPHAPEYVALRRGESPTYQDVQCFVDRFMLDGALVSFFTRKDEILVFVIRAGDQGPALVRVSVPEDELLSHAQKSWPDVVEYTGPSDRDRTWEELAQLFLAKILPSLKGVEYVCLIPHGLLHYVPLHALPVEDHYLIDEFPIFYAPSIAVLMHVCQRKVGRELKQRPEALVVGNPTEDLAYSEREATHIADLFGVQPLLRKGANKAKIVSELAHKDVVHLACHGHFDPGQPLQSSIILANNEHLTAQEIMALRLRADLVTLSACETGLNELSRGDELSGLTRAFLYGGASSSLVSLWQVSDESTAQLMTEFYNRVYDSAGSCTKTKALALQEAMIEIRKMKDHPHYWAPFILVGDWQ